MSQEISEIYVFPKELFEELIEADEQLKKRTHTDAVHLYHTGEGTLRLVQQIRLLGVLGTAYIKVIRGKENIVFKGPPGLRPRLQATRMLRTNPRVAMFVVGSREIIKDALKATKVAVIAFVALDVLQEILQDHVSLARLGVKVASDISQAMIAVGAGAVAGVIATTVFAAPVVVAFAIVVAVGFLAAIALTTIDEQYGLTDKAVARMMALESRLKSDIADRVNREIRRDVAIAIAAAERYAANLIWSSIERLVNFNNLNRI